VSPCPPFGREVSVAVPPATGHCHCSGGPVGARAGAVCLAGDDDAGFAGAPDARDGYNFNTWPG
jgi:hypothetical protein